jgi:hypothetical protein
MMKGGFAAGKKDKMHKADKIEKMDKALLSLRSSYFIGRLRPFIARSAFIGRAVPRSIVHCSLFIVHCLLLLSACDTRRDILDDQGVWVHMEVDWQQAGILPEGTSIYIFNRETGLPVRQFLTNEMRDSLTCDSLKLHAGHYSLLVFNETERSHDYLSFRGTDRYHSAEAYASPLALPATGRFAGVAAAQPDAVRTMVAATDVLATAGLDHFELGYDVIRSQVHPRLRFTPERRSVTADVIIHLQNMHSLYTGRQQVGVLTSMAEGVFLATGHPNDVPAAYWFALTAVHFDPDTKSGTLSASFATFGACASGNNDLDLYFLLHDGTEFTYHCDVTALLHAAEITPERRLVVEVGLGLTPDDPLIVLPDLPAGDDGMFKVGVGGWDDTDDIDIPI